MRANRFGKLQSSQQGNRAEDEKPATEAMAHEPLVFYEVNRHFGSALFAGHRQFGLSLSRHFSQTLTQSISKYKTRISSASSRLVSAAQT